MVHDTARQEKLGNEIHRKAGIANENTDILCLQSVAVTYGKTTVRSVLLLRMPQMDNRALRKALMVTRGLTTPLVKET